jgi:hypothetical protein|tara:strand:- start:872 stop:1231 length:360 start_codon:yes stop_codon:yes gene_type:complete
MENLALLAELALLLVSISVAYVWIFRFHNVLKEFKQFGLSDTTRNFVGATKISLATLLIVGVFIHSLVFIPALLMGLIMLAAQFFHFKIRNPFIKYLPSLLLFILSAFVVFSSIYLKWI